MTVAGTVRADLTITPALSDFSHLAGPVEEPPETGVDIGIDASIPAKYIPDLRSRVEAYRLAVGAEDLDAARELLADRFGPPPPEVDNFLKVVKVKHLASGWRLSSVAIHPPMSNGRRASWPACGFSATATSISIRTSSKSAGGFCWSAISPSLPPREKDDVPASTLRRILLMPSRSSKAWSMQ